MSVLDKFSLQDKIALVTGGEGKIGTMIRKVVTELGGHAISIDIKETANIRCNIANFHQIEHISKMHCDILINNAIGNQAPVANYIDGWNWDTAVGLTGAANMIMACEKSLCARNGVILNMGSDLSLIGPDQSLYPDGKLKPLSYSVVKHGIIGLTRYFATLWPNVRCNCLCPGGIASGQNVPAVPMGRLARLDELQGPIAFLISDASSYMTGAMLSVDGGRTAW